MRKLRAGVEHRSKEGKEKLPEQMDMRISMIHHLPAARTLPEILQVRLDNTDKAAVVEHDPGAIRNADYLGAIGSRLRKRRGRNSHLQYTGGNQELYRKHY